MNKDSNISGNESQERMPSVQEQGEIRSALNRMDIEAPDAEQAWKDLSSMLNLGEHENLKEPADLKESDGFEEVSVPVSSDAEPSLRIRISMSTVRKTVISLAAIMLIAFLVVKNVDIHPTSENVSAGEKLTEKSAASAGKKAASAVAIYNKVEKRAVPPTSNSDTALEMLRAETGRGKSRQLVLNDGTTVWLNAESALLYPKQFSGSQRRVQLKGEAYFEVKHNASCPFVVEAASLVATDLGTAFDVKAYPGKSTQLILVSGKVAVQKKGEEAQSVVMKPNQMLTLEAGKMQISSVDTYPLIQWKNGKFYFHHISVLEAMKEIGRWYGVKVVFENKTCLNTQIHFVEERNTPVDEIVERLNEIEGVDIELLNQEITIK